METNINTNNTKLLTSLYTTPQAAEQAYNVLINKVYSKNDISVIMSDKIRDKYFTNTDLPKDSLGTKAVERMVVRGAIGAAQ